MKLSKKKWKSLISGVLLAASASSFLIAPVYAADYSKPLIGTLKKDSEILSPDGNTVTENDGKLIYDFQGKDHTFTITNKDGITARKDSVYNNVGADGSYGTIHIYQTNDKSNAWAGVNGFTANKGTIVVNSNLDITATSEYASVGIAAANKGNLIINGNVKMRKDNAEKPWGIITGNVHGNVGPGGATSMGGDANYTGARWQPAGISVDYTRGDVTINGDVDIAVRGTAVKTDVYQADGDVPAYDLGTISLLGNSIRIDTPYREENFVEGFGKFIEPYYALASYGGTINVNVKNQEAQNGKVEMVGNVLAMKSSDEAGKAMVYQNGRLNIGLTTQDSSWKGVIDNAGTAKAGEVNLWLQNGAQWIYENASRKDGLDASNLADYSRPYYEKYDGVSHLSSLVGGKDKASAGIIKVNDSDPIHIANAEGVTKVWYEHDDATPGNIIGGDIKVLNAKAGTEMMLYTGNNGISKGFAEGDTAAEKNNVSEVLNSLAHKLWYMAGDSNLAGSVSIAEGLTASSVTMKTGNITFAEGGQGFYDYTPEKDDKTYATGPIVKSENIGETRESDINGVVSVNVTEAQDSVASSAPSAMYAAGEAEGPLVVDLQGHTLKLNANNQTANYVSTVYVDENKSMEIKDSKGNGVLKVSAGLGADGNPDTKAKYVYGIRVGEGGNLTANTDVEIDGVKSSATQRAYGVYVGTKGNVVFEKDLSIKNVQTGNKVGPNTAGIYADSSSSADAPINITVKGNLNIENVLGSAIRALNTSTISTGGATIKAADMSNGTDYSQYYALQANKGTINLNTGEGITAGILDVTGDMKVTDNKASVINVNMTKGSQWTGAVSNIPSSTYNAPAGQFNLIMDEGSVWNHETGRSVDTLKTTFAGSNVSKLDGSGVIYQNSDKGITVYDYSGDTTVVYGHDADNPLTINGGNFTVKTAAAGSKITLVTDSQGINAGFEASDTAAEKNNVKEILNKLANKLFYTGYKDANLAGVVKIADGLTASSVSATVKASGDVTFSDGSNGTKTAGQGFYDYTPEQEKPNYKTGAITSSENISLNREVDDKGVAHINVTESNAGNNKFASALYAGEETSPSKPMTVNMSGKGLALNVAQTGGQAAAIYAGANTYIKVINPSADQKLAITANNTDTRGSHGVYADGNAHLNISGPVEITDIVTKGDSATGINIQGQKSEINIDGPLTISNVKGTRERGKGMNASGIQVTGDTSTVTVSGPVDISGVRGSGIRLTGKDTKVAVGGGTITAAEDSDKSHNFYAVRVDKGTLDINMKDGAAGDTTTKITGDMYATGQYGKKVVEYTGGELINWNDAGVLNVALTDKDSFWKGVAAYDMYNDDYGSGGNTTHDIGQFNLYLQNGAIWTNEQQSHVTTTTIASKNPVWTGSTLATLHGGKDADNAGLIYQKDNNPISVVNYSGHTTVFYDHDAADPTKIIGGSFNITNAAEGSAITFITDNKGITSGFADGDSADAKDKVANVLNNLAGKLFYKNYTDGHLAGVVKIADGLTASSAALKTGDISFSTEETGTFTPGQGYYDYKTSKPGSQITKEFTTAITGDAAADTVYIEKGVLKDDGTYVFTADSTTITPEKHLIAGGAWLPQISAAISGSDENHNVTIDMNGNKLTVDTTTDTHTTGIAAIGKGVVNINNAGAMSVSATSTTNGQTGALFVNAGGTINIHNAGADNVLTLRANSAAPANAAVIKSMNGVSGVMSAITVDGLVDILADKSNASGANEAISAVASKVEIGGGVIKAINGAEYAISAYGEFASKNRGQVNVNVKKDAEGSIIGAGNNNVQMEGNVNLGGGMDSAGASADVSIGLNTKESFWKGDVSNTNGSSAGIVNLYMGNGASWTGNNLSGNTVNANLDNATWTGYSNGNAMHLKLDNSIWNVNGASKLASFSGNNGSIIVANNAGNINVAEYSGNTNVIYNHDADNPTNILGGSFTIGQANTGSNITLITDNKGITKGFNAYDKAEDQNTVNEVLNKLAQKLFYTANDGKLAGIVKIASGLTASSAALKTGDISFSTDATGTKTPGQGFYEYTEMDDSVITDPITGNLDKKYVSLGIETEKGIYNFTKDTVINVTKGDYSSNLSAIESSGGPITINADGHSLDVAYHVLKGSNVARAVATGLSYGKSKDITIKAKSLKLSTDTTGFRAQGVYATGGKITIDADTTITTSAQTESNGIYSGSGGTVTMNGNLDIQKDSKAANYIALNSDDNGIINVNVKNGKAGAGIVKIDGDVFTKSAETYDYWEDETTSTSSTVNLALQGKDSSWNGRSLYEVTSGDDSTSYGTFNLWLTDGATWTNEKNGKEVPNGFNGSHVTNFTGGADAAHAGNIFQKDSKNLTVDNYSGNTNIFYAHTGNGEAAADYKAGDTVIKHAAEGSVVSLITDNSGIAMDNEYSIANVLNTLAGKLTYSNFVNGENNLTGYVKIADGLTASSKAMQTGDISFSSKDGKGSLKDGSITPGLTYPDTQTPESSKLNSGITGDAKTDYQYKKDGILKEDGSYVFTQDPTVIEVKEGAAVNATAKDIVIDTTKAKLELKGETGINAENGNVTLNGSTVINGTDAAINAGENANVNVNGNNSALTINGSINANGGNITVDSGKASSTITGDINAANGGSVVISLIEKNSVMNGGYNVDGNSSIALSLANGATWNLTDGEEAAGMSLLRIAKAPAAAPAKGLTINGGKTEAETGYLNMTKRSKALQIANYSGWETIIYNHDNKGSEAQEFKSGNTVISNAKEGSGVILFTDSNNININSQAEVEAVLKVLAEKVQYTDHAANGANLKGKVRIAEGFTSAGKTGAMKWDETTGIGKFDPSSIKWGEIYNGDYETLVMKGVRSAATTSMHSWRDNMQDTFTGATNLWLQNGATWTNEQQGVLPSVWGGEQFKGSRVNKLAGGATAEAAGNIYQNDSNSLTIDNYSGVTNIIYAHGGDGTSYAAGDTVIKHAEAGSVVNMITSNQGVTDISAALNALAGKLTYLNYATANGSERNLNGYVKLAGGLTSDSVTMVTGDIRFSEETGKGSGTDNIKFADEPDNQTAKTFNSTLTGERLKDLEYVMGGVVKDGTYKFTENTAINVSGEGAKGMDFVKDTAVDASGKTLTVNVTEASKGNAGISQDVDVNSTIKADKLVIKLDSEKSGKGAQAIRQDKGNLTIDANVDIDVKGDNSTMGIYSHAGSTTVNGDVKVVLDGKRGGFNEYGAAGIYAHAGYGGAVGGTVNVNGNVDISGVGNGLFANIGGATINVNGGKINIVDTDKKNGYSAIYATCGAINMNTVKDAAGKVIGAGNNKVDITGNVVVSVGAVNYVDCCTETEVNLGLTTKDSKLTGVVYNQFPEGGKTVSQRGDSKTFTGAANLWLQNGALWTNEQQGELPSVWGGEQFKGSFVTNLVGGTNADNAGQIYQKDSNNLTIDTLSGSIRVIYDHEFEDAETRAAGDKKIVYKAGNTVINNAKDGSQVIMATGSNGINTFDKDSVEDAFKGLANKLIYKDAEKNPGNLKAELQLGGGLTGSNVSWSGQIEWDGNNGSYKLDSAEQSIKLLYDEDAVSKDTRAAIMSGMVGWRNAATDTYRARAGAYGEDNQGVWARTWGGQNKYTGNNTSFKNSYWAGQVGYDKTLANGWNVGVAFDYMTGDDSYYAGSGDTKTYTLGLYGSKEISNNEFIDLTAKVGRVSNDFETKDILGRTVKGDYKANGFSFSGQYSKRFGSEAAGYFEPQAQLTIGRLGSSDFDSTGTLEGHISQDAFTSIVGRLGIEAGQASEHGRYFARLSLSHEFAGDVDTHFSDSSASMTREFNLDGTWCDLTVGGTYDLSDKVSFYGDVTKTLTGDYKQDWKVNAGLRFTF
ncbi:hypothetical protein [Phascolarctobacterium succinatutens]|uniref:hypothetical protein n=1 Tax=Phascolarctobacterium succinatutens TaxID=626940 RepID=UPI0026EDB86E|nr:hypothetical protein [Phascolarctobacterium succinatutens]